MILPFRIAARAVLVLAVGGVLTATSGKAQDPRPLGQQSVAGQLLVAAPSMPDPRFRRTVILMMAHDRNGAIGFVINRIATRRPIREVLRALGRSTGDIDGSIDIHWGGPVSPGTAVVVHGTDYRGPGTRPIGTRFRISGNTQVIVDIGRRKGPKRYFFARGYSGWGPGQLDRELKTRHWLVIPAEPGLVFPKDKTAVWERALKRRGTDL